MIRSPLLALLVVATALAPAASALPGCFGLVADYSACAFAGVDYGVGAIAGVYGPNGERAEATVLQQEAFIGNVLIALVWVDVGPAGAYGGLGASDWTYDGFYEHVCVCAEAYGPMGNVLIGVGHFDYDYDGEIEPEHVYVELLTP